MPVRPGWRSAFDTEPAKPKRPRIFHEFTAAIREFSARIEEQMCPFARQLEQLATIPGVGPAVAEVIVAETGADHESVPHRRAHRFVGRGESRLSRIRGRRRSGKTRHGTGNRWQVGALGTATMAAAR